MILTLFDAIARYDHDMREENGETVHSYQCRRCNLERLANDLRAKVQNFSREINELVGKPIEQKA